MQFDGRFLAYLMASGTLVQQQIKENRSMSMIHKDPRKEEEPSPEPIDPPTDAPPLEAPQDPAKEPNI